MAKKTVPVELRPAEPSAEEAVPRGRPRKYDWAKLDVGEAVVVQQVKGVPTVASVASSCSYYARHRGVKFQVRAMSGGRIHIFRKD